MSNKELVAFLLQQCKERGLSLRKLSISSGLSPGTVHNIIKRQYQPTLFSLNRLADYLGVKREYLWQLAGLLEDMDYGNSTFGDPQLRFYFARLDKLPVPTRNLMVSIIEAAVIHLESTGKGISSPDCPLNLPICCHDCEWWQSGKCTYSVNEKN